MHDDARELAEDQPVIRRMIVYVIVGCVVALALVACTRDIPTEVNCTAHGYVDVVRPTDARYAQAESTFTAMQTLYLAHGGLCISEMNFDGTGYETMQCDGCWVDNSVLGVDSMPPIS